MATKGNEYPNFVYEEDAIDDSAKILDKPLGYMNTPMRMMGTVSTPSYGKTFNSWNYLSPEEKFYANNSINMPPTDLWYFNQKNKAPKGVDYGSNNLAAQILQINGLGANFATPRSGQPCNPNGVQTGIDNFSGIPTPVVCKVNYQTREAIWTTPDHKTCMAQFSRLIPASACDGLAGDPKGSKTNDYTSCIRSGKQSYECDSLPGSPLDVPPEVVQVVEKKLPAHPAILLAMGTLLGYIIMR